MSDSPPMRRTADRRAGEAGLPGRAPDIGKLRDLVARLRSPDGCPWDREQTLGDLRAYLLEEAHEVAAAIDAEDWTELAGELGDLLFHVVFIARLAEEEGLFELADVVDAIHAKMIDRHPHVFGEEKLRDAEAVRRSWEERKLAERRAGAGGPEPERRSLLAGVPSSLPALTGAYRIAQKAAGLGFDWPHAGAVLQKVREELGEVEQLLAGPEGDERRKRAALEEVGDLLFAVASLARHLEIDPEAALARGNLKFRRRFQELEEVFRRDGRSLADATLEEMDREWQAIKGRERRDGAE